MFWIIFTLSLILSAAPKGTNSIPRSGSVCRASAVRLLTSGSLIGFLFVPVVQFAVLSLVFPFSIACLLLRFLGITDRKRRFSASGLLRGARFSAISDQALETMLL